MTDPHMQPDSHPQANPPEPLDSPQTPLLDAPSGSAPPIARPTEASQREMVDKAINLLSHHVPSYGDKPYGLTDHEAWKSDPPDKMASAPDPLKASLGSALASAARFLDRVFQNESRVYEQRHGKGE